MDDEHLEVARRANRPRRGLAGEQGHLTERPARVHAADAVLRPAAAGDEDVGDARLDDVELVGGVALGDHRRAGREAAARQLVERALDLLRRHAVEHRAASRWTRYRCLMRFDRCQAPIVLPRHPIGVDRPDGAYACRVVMVDASNRELEPGDTLGPYRLESVLGEGGMGLVFKAHRDGDDRPVALKVLKRQLSGDLIFQQRFQHEARAAAEVRDRHLVAILESAEWDGRHCLASDYVDGGSLTERIASGGPLPLADVVRVVTEVGDRARRAARGGRHAPRHQAFERPLRQ